jgi:hypothetical protein
MKKEDRIAKLLFGTMFLGIIIDLIFIWTTNKCESPEVLGPCEPYTLYLFLSLAIGLILSSVFLKLEHKK